MIRQPISELIWKSKYCNDNETEEEFYARIPRGLFAKTSKKHLNIYNKMMGCDIQELTEQKLKDHKCFLAGRGMYAIGTNKTKQTFSNCFVIPIKSDSMKAIMECAMEAAMTMKAGGGVGYSISILRPPSVKISSANTFSSGAVSFLKILDSTCSVIKAGGDRRGAQMVAMGVWHPSIKEFITAKRNGDLTNFNMSVFISDAFMTAAENDEDWDLIFPDTTHPKYDTVWDGNIKLWESKGYPVIVHETVKAKELLDLILESNYKFAEPGVLFEDIINERNTLWWIEYIQTTNPCGEQPLAWYGSCNLGPVNISNHVQNMFAEDVYFDWDEYKESVKLMTILLDKMLDSSYFPLQEHYDEVRDKRLIGIGFTGLADAMAKLKIKYNSQEGVDFAEKIMRIMSEVAYDTSADLAKHFGAFELYNKKMLQSYNVEILPAATKLKIKRYGLRNSRATSIAPTGTTSLVMNNTSSGVEPIFALDYERHVLQNDGTKKTELVENDAWNLYKNSEFYDGNVPEYFVLTEDLNPMDHISVQAAVQKWCCTSISKTINLPVDIPFKDFKNVYLDAYHNKLKGCTTYRPNSVLGSVIEVKKEIKDEQKSAKKEQKEFFDIWKDHDKGNIVHDNVDIPPEYPMRGYKITSEGKKWYVNVAFKDKKGTRPFALFVNTNNREAEVNTYDAIEKLEILAHKKGISRELIDKNKDKCNGQTNVNKIVRTLGLCLRHNVKIIDVIKTLDNVDVPISSFIFRIKKFLMMFIDEIPANGKECPECGSPVVFRDGCESCSECFYSKCS